MDPSRTLMSRSVTWYGEFNAADIEGSGRARGAARADAGSSHRRRRRILDSSARGWITSLTAEAQVPPRKPGLARHVVPEERLLAMKLIAAPRTRVVTSTGAPSGKASARGLRRHRELRQQAGNLNLRTGVVIATVLAMEVEA